MLLLQCNVNFKLNSKHILFFHELPLSFKDSVTYIISLFKEVIWTFRSKVEIHNFNATNNDFLFYFKQLLFF